MTSRGWTEHRVGTAAVVNHDITPFLTMMRDVPPSPPGPPIRIKLREGAGETEESARVYALIPGNQILVRESQYPSFLFPLASARPDSPQPRKSLLQFSSWVHVAGFGDLIRFFMPGFPPLLGSGVNVSME